MIPGQQQHEMYLEQTHLSGVEEWCCPVCGRRILINWEPKFWKSVLDVGDEYAMHSGGKGGIQVGSMQVSPVDPRLDPWIRWFDENDFDSLWD